VKGKTGGITDNLNTDDELEISFHHIMCSDSNIPHGIAAFEIRDTVFFDREYAVVLNHCEIGAFVQFAQLYRNMITAHAAAVANRPPSVVAYRT
jgi:hypothetical protein